MALEPAQSRLANRFPDPFAAAGAGTRDYCPVVAELRQNGLCDRLGAPALDAIRLAQAHDDFVVRPSLIRSLLFWPAALLPGRSAPERPAWPTNEYVESQGVGTLGGSHERGKPRRSGASPTSARIESVVDHHSFE